MRNIAMTTTDLHVTEKFGRGKSEKIAAFITVAKHFGATFGLEERALTVTSQGSGMMQGSTYINVTVRFEAAADLKAFRLICPSDDDC